MARQSDPSRAIGTLDAELEEDSEESGGHRRREQSNQVDSARFENEFFSESTLNNY